MSLEVADLGAHLFVQSFLSSLSRRVRKKLSLGSAVEPLNVLRYELTFNGLGKQMVNKVRKSAVTFLG